MKRLAFACAILVAACAVWFAMHAQRAAERDRADGAAREQRDERGAGASANESSDPATRELAVSREAISVAEAAPTPRHPVLRVVDDRTGEPAPFYRLAIERDGHDPIEFETDAAGRAELPSAEDATLEFVEFTRGADRIQTLRAALAAIARTTELHAADLARGELEVRAPVGPTYRLRIAPPPGRASADLTATLKAADPRQMFDSVFADLREGEQPWLRFRAAALCLSGGPPWKLELATRDGLWYGAAEVASNVGVQRELVDIAFEQRARLFGPVRDDAGELQAGFVRIERDGASFESTVNRPLLGLIDQQGSYALRCVPAGKYTVRFHAENHHDFESVVDLAAGEARELAITVERMTRAELVELEGRVESESGAFRGKLSVYAVPPEGQSLSPRRCDVTWSDIEGRAVGIFAIDVPKTEYRVRINGSGLVEVDPVEQTWKSDSGQLRFVLRDSKATGRLEFRAVDAATKAPIANFLVGLDFEPRVAQRSTAQSTREGVVAFDSVPLGATLAYRAIADGHQSIWGECAAALDGSVAPIELAFAPGWSSEVTAEDETGAPLAGVRVVCDGELAGVTDERGLLRASVGRVPASMQFELAGWRAVDSSTYSAATGRFRSWEPWARVTMQRVEER